MKKHKTWDGDGIVVESVMLLSGKRTTVSITQSNHPCIACVGILVVTGATGILKDLEGKE